MSKRIQSLYLHFPFCRHLCNYCDFYKKVPKDSALEIDEFHSYMKAAMIEHENLMKMNGCSWGPLKTLYIGGGTPSLWGEAGSTFLKNLLQEYKIELAPDCEFTLEVNPGSWTVESLDSWEAIGVNRYSLGIQSLNGHSIKYLDRVHTLEDVFETLEYFNKKKVNYSMDFMLGLPYSKETSRDVIDELERALKYNPKHFSVYILTVKDNYTHYAHLPNEEWIEKEYMQVADFLKSKGFLHYEVSNFALPGYESKHNLNYWKSESVAAVGPSATGFYSESRVRYKWKTKEAKVEIENLDEEAFKLEKIYMAMRSSEGLAPELFQGKPGYDQLIEKWKNAAYVEVNPAGHVYVTSKGYLLLDSLMSDLFSLKLL
ncbi:coproporphyrinogen-III oxidase family protein [Bacteriovorax sp. PP10]|uniref:Heme chaperone HemW n=1 Tax=Bacteriovorax antarcticus TaxID=3088717 RepID=A0ABU5VPQ1_9BACT|nr:coproporphyrinogen-III oxidase family protein [Bacteriovorax sp. PP10]MEA9354976.1 coproporphyrinogen-III oxidase family protein [Bacteriovorax sp. PP10]